MNNSILYYLFVLFLIVPTFSYTQKVTIEFKNKSYAGDSISVYTYSDYITENEKLLATTKVNDSGYFKCSFKLSSTSQIYIPLHLFKVSMFAEPNKTYHIIVPPKKNLDIEDELNPFFTRIDILPGIVNSDSLELNYQINSFNNEYENYIIRFFNKMYYTARKSVPDSVISSFEKKYSYSTNSYFKTYLKYKLNMLRYMAYERDDNYVIKYRFNNEPVYYDNVSYMELFNDIFKHYLSISIAKKWGTKILDDIAKSKSPAELRITLKNNPAFSNDTLIDLVILKGLHDAFYAEKISGYRTFPGKQLYMTLDSMICCSKISSFRIIANNIKQKVLKLAPGTTAPSFYLLNQDSVRIGLSDLKGKYLLINFYDFRSYTFQSEMTLLGNIATKFHNNLDIVTIVNSTSPYKLNEFVKNNNFNWQFLIAENTKILFNDYSVKAFPSYYLIDPYGKIVLSPSPGPDGNFDAIFANILSGRN